MSRSHGLVVSRSMPVLVRQQNSNVTAAERERHTEGGDENIHGTQTQGPQAWEEGVAQLNARNQEPEEGDSSDFVRVT